MSCNHFIADEWCSDRPPVAPIAEVPFAPKSDDPRTRYAALSLEAIDAVCGARNRDYGPIADDMANLALCVTAYLRQRGLLTSEQSVEGFDMPMILKFVKQMRLGHTPGHHDSVVDDQGWTFGYVDCCEKPGLELTRDAT